MAGESHDGLNPNWFYHMGANRGETRNEALYAACTNAEARDSNYENGRQPLDDKLAPDQCPYIAYEVCITRGTPWRELERSSTPSLSGCSDRNCFATIYSAYYL